MTPAGEGGGEPALLVLWERLFGDLLDRTAKFPTAVRFTFAARIDGIVLEFLVAEARWAPVPRRRELLAQADLLLVRLHVLLGLACDRRYLDTGGFEHVVCAAASTLAPSPSTLPDPAVTVNPCRRRCAGVRPRGYPRSARCELAGMRPSSARRTAPA